MPASESEVRLLEAVREGDAHLVRRLVVDERVSMKGTGEYREGAVHIAAGLESPECLRILLQAGAAADDECGDGYTPLDLALRDCRREQVELLLAAGARLLDGLSTMASNGYADGLELAIALAKEQRFGVGPAELSRVMNTSVFDAIMCGEAGIDPLAILLRDGAGADAVKYFEGTRPGWTMALHCAVQSGFAEQLVLLLDHGADLDAVDSDGNTPAALASAVGSTEALAILNSALARRAVQDALERMPSP